MNDKVIQLALDSEVGIAKYLYALTESGRLFVGNQSGEWKEIKSPIEVAPPSGDTEENLINL